MSVNVLSIPYAREEKRSLKVSKGGIEFTTFTHSHCEGMK